MRIAALLFCCGWVPVMLFAEPKPKKVKPTGPPDSRPVLSLAKPEQPQLFEFQGDELPLVLRTLARQALMNVVIGDNVKGSVTLRLEQKTPREALEVVCQLKGLKLEENAGVYFITDPNAVAVPEAPNSFNFSGIVEGLLTPENMSAATKLYDAMLDIQARPETAKKVARARKLLLDALMEEGFTRDEAMKILLYSGKMELPDFKN
jgi:type II secretory pathway component GspD/PulD (secretin)